MPNPRTIPLLPCADIDEIEPFFAALGFRTTYRQHRPYQSLALNGHGIDLQYYGLDGHTPESSHSSCLVIVDDTGPIWEELAAGLREAYGKLPITGFPRITRPRARKNADGVSGFSLIDPAGNWLRFFRDGSADTSPTDLTRLGEAVQNAAVLADSKGDVAQAAKVLAGAIKRAPADDPAQGEAQSFMQELSARLSDG
ncbi:MAG: VOC family protein [Nocardioides sp.]|uniref:VOC family protein n=1 Tax=Nocardioides sp. TaxID=35761 RepID=UPI003EFF168F